jgi:hypothetical protein
MMNFRSLVACFALLASISAMPASAATYDYSITPTLFTQEWTGTITTDCNNCTLSYSDIVSININLFVDPLNPINVIAIVGGEQNDLTATPSGIFFNFDGGTFPTSYETVLFAHDPFGTGVYSALDSDQTSISSGGGANGLGLVQFASAVPESSTWAMLLIGFAGIGFAAYRRHQLPNPAGTVSAYAVAPKLAVLVSPVSCRTTAAK